MALTRNELIALSLRYFEGCNAHNHEQVMSTLSEDSVMWFSAAAFRYTGHEALGVHFDDFLGTFPTINFHDFTHIADETAQRICSFFTVILIDDDGNELRMNNCNVFKVDDAGLFCETGIFNSGALDQGFHAGSD